MKKTTYYFGESVRYLENEKEEALQYLRSWKKFLIRKLNKDCMSVRVVDEQFIERDPMLVDVLAQYWMISLKLALEVDFKFEVEPFGLK